MARPKWDMTSLHSLDAGAEWLRKQADARLVLVVRGEDVAVALDPLIAPKDAETMVEVAMPEIHARLEEQRQAARAEAGKKIAADVYAHNVAAVNGVSA